jgi:hypothetical protein
MGMEAYMHGVRWSFAFLAILLATDALVGGVPPTVASTQQGVSTSSSQQQTALDVKGTWSGTFFSRHSDVSPFTLTVVINPEAEANFVGESTLNSNCLKGAKLQVKVTGSTVVLAGSDPEGDNITIRGTIDSTGTLLKSSYVLNGSASGKCETDDGTGSLGKR